MTEDNKIASGLEAANAIVTQVVPLVGVVMMGVRLMYALAKHAGADVGEFDAEIASLDAKAAEAQSAIDDYNTRFRNGGDVDAPTGS